MKSLVRALVLAGSLGCSSFALAADLTSERWYAHHYNINLVGKIEPGDDDHFKELLLSEIRKGHLISGLRLYSPGGSVDDAMSIGRQTRLLQLSTMAPFRDSEGTYCPFGSFDHEQHRRDLRCECASACFLIWAAGLGREGDDLGIHHPYYDQDYYKSLEPTEARKVYTEMSSQLTAYLKSVDVPDNITNKMYRYMSYEIYRLNETELDSLRNARGETSCFTTAAESCPTATFFRAAFTMCRREEQSWIARAPSTSRS